MLAIFFLGTTPSVDLAGAELLIDLRQALTNRGIEFRLAEAHGGVRDTLQRTGFVDPGGKVDPHQTVAAVLHSWRETESATVAVGRVPAH